MKLRRVVDVAIVALVLDAGVSAIEAVSRNLPVRITRTRGQPGSSPAAPDPHALASGAAADTPSEIPARGWKQIVRRVFTQIGENRVMAEAASVTYYTLLAIFPAIAALISIYGLVADPASIGKHLSALGSVVPGGGMQIINDQVHALTSAPGKALGLGAIVGLLTSLWSANAAIKSLFDALNAVYGQRETRTFIHRTWLSLAFTVGALLFVILAIGAVVVVPAILAFVGLGTAADLLLNVGRWPVMLATLAMFLALIYRYGPSRTTAKWRWISWGSVFAAVAWVIASAAFSYYAANFGNFNKTYGSLGAVIGFMTWIWISAIIVLVGAELNAEMEHQTGADSTTGMDKPLGARGAVRADRVAAE